MGFHHRYGWFSDLVFRCKYVVVSRYATSSLLLQSNIKALQFLMLKMSATKKRVRFHSANEGRPSKSLSETLTLRHIETPDSTTNSFQKKKKKKKQTKLQGLKAEKRKLQKDLKNTKENILDDNERKASPVYTRYENRQRLARTASETLSKLQQLEGKIATKEKTNKHKIQRKLSTKLKRRSIRADKQHNRLIKMTANLERMKMEEEELRAEIARELTEGEKKDILPDAELNPLRLPRIKSADVDSAQWINISASTPEYKIDSEQDESSRPTSVLSESALQLTPSEKRIVADKLAHKYDMTRELRNTIHEHMITRSYSFSYFNIIPPYKRKKPKPQKTKQVFNRLVYEDKIGVMDFTKKYPKKAVLST